MHNTHVAIHTFISSIIPSQLACACHIPGVANNGDCARESSNGVQMGDCRCKENVKGRTCSQCLAGYFNLSLANPEGCQGIYTF